MTDRDGTLGRLAYQPRRDDTTHGGALGISRAGSSPPTSRPAYGQ